jgi:hypothetical protein
VVKSCTWDAHPGRVTTLSGIAESAMLTMLLYRLNLDLAETGPIVKLVLQFVFMYVITKSCMTVLDHSLMHGKAYNTFLDTFHSCARLCSFAI